jgi:hypothetical protein
MPAVRKTLAKYGAKIPTARNTGAKQGQTGKQAKPTDTVAEAGEATQQGGSKKR